jgi:dihydrofolate reductase
MHPERVLIVAVSENDAIGYKGHLPWPKIPEDRKHFRDLTMGHPVIVGRKTHESIGGPLKGRLNLVVTNNPALYNQNSKLPSNLKFVHSIEEALDEGYKNSEFYEDWNKIVGSAFKPRVFFAGGGAICQEVLEKGYVDVIEYTRVYGTYPADVFIPKINWSEWAAIRYQHLPNCSFIAYKKR